MAIFIVAGVYFATSAHVRTGRLAATLVADVFFTLAAACGFAILAAAFPKSPFLLALAQNTFRKLWWILAIAAVMFFALLLFVIP